MLEFSKNYLQKLNAEVLSDLQKANCLKKYYEYRHVFLFTVNLVRVERLSVMKIGFIFMICGDNILLLK